MKLSSTGIYGTNVSCAALNETVGKTTGGSTYVNATLIGNVNFEAVKSALKLKSAATYVSVCLGYLNFMLVAVHIKGSFSNTFSVKDYL